MLVPPPLLALAGAVAQRALTGPTAPPGPGRALGAVAVASASVALAGSAVRGFRTRGTTVDPFRPERASVLVTDGPNAVTRNPMYVGLAGMLVAHALWRGSPAALLPVVAFVGWIDRVQVAAEEPALQVTFGAAYDDYRATTPRWLGPGSRLRRADR